ncbi:MAG: hypothetical protein ACYC0X_05960 [Pirellulaceae bacterium]
MNNAPKIRKCFTGTCINPALPGMWECAACRAKIHEASVRAAERSQRAKALVTASELPVLDTSEAFRPGSPHWGSNVSPTAKVVSDDADRPPTY